MSAQCSVVMAYGYVTCVFNMTEKNHTGTGVDKARRARRGRPHVDPKNDSGTSHPGCSCAYDRQARRAEVSISGMP